MLFFRYASMGQQRHKKWQHTKYLETAKYIERQHPLEGLGQQEGRLDSNVGALRDSKKNGSPAS